MKFQVDKELFADAVAWTAKSLPARPAMPILAGIFLDLTDGESGQGRLTISSFDYEVGSLSHIEATVHSSGRALVSGRLLAEITRALPAHPVHVSSDGSRIEITCGSARFTVPTLPLEDYPSLPEMPQTAGTVEAELFATAVAQVAVAAGRDETLPILTGVHMEIEGENLTLIATDRYRLALRELSWKPGTADLSRHALVPSRALVETAKTLASEKEVSVALSGDKESGLLGFSSGDRRTTTRLLEGEYPNVRNLLPSTHTARATVSVQTMAEVVKRVSLVAERNTPVLLRFADQVLTVEAGGTEDARASESMDAQFEEADNPSGDVMEWSIAFNPQFLLDGLGAIRTETVVFSFTHPAKPAVLVGVNSEGVEQSEYRYVLMPIRLTQ